MNFHGSRVIVTQSIFKTGAPARRFGRQPSQSEKVRRKIETRIESATAVETDLLGIQFIEIMKDSAVREAFVIIERMFEQAHATGITIEHQVFADQTRRIGPAVWKLFVGGVQQQSRSLRAVRADHDGLRPLQLRVLPLVEIGNAGDTARTVPFKATNVGIWANFTPPGSLRKRDHAGKCAGLRAYLTRKAPTESAAYTGASPGTRLRKYRHRSGKRVPAKLAARTFENYT